ncbi:MAG: type IV secretory system conjugative DNA transfer family protein [Solobacterium sp.]|nr:type IV secretory system conjugative DNA transfer family protein [Solobacterium sp.]
MENIPLGRSTTFTPETETGLNGNILVTGGTGAGKTVSVMEPLLLHGTFDSNAIISLTKQRLAREYGRMLEERGYHVYYLNTQDPDRGNVCFDPVHYICSEDDIQNLAHNIVMCNSEKKTNSRMDPYWDESAVTLLCALIGIALMLNENATMYDVLKLYEKAAPREDSYSIRTDLDSEMERLAKLAPESFAVRKWHIYSCLPYRTGSCVYSSLAAPLEQMFSENCRRMIADMPSIDFRKFAEEKSVLFILASPVNMSSYRYINLFWSAAFKELLEYAQETEDQRLPRKVRMCCDDFATGSVIPHFDEYISIFRECGVSCVLLLQSETQLNNMYGEQAARTIINNCDTYISMSTMDYDTAVSVSKRIDLPVKEVLEMPVDKICIFRKGHRAVIDRRYDTYEDPLYLQVHSSDR